MPLLEPTESVSSLPYGGTADQVLAKLTDNDFDVYWKDDETGGGGGGSGDWGDIGGTLSDQTDLQSALDAKQPLDSDLTAIAALATDSFGLDLLIKTTGANVRSYIGAGTSSFDGVFASLTSKPTTIAGYGITDFNSLGDARWQATDSDLTSIAGLTATTDNFIVSVASAWASRTPAQVRTTLALVIGTNVQAWDADLDTIAGLTATTDNFLVSVSSAWASRTPAQVRTTLSLVIGTNVQAWDADLDTIAGLTATTDNFLVSVSSAWASRTPTQVKTTLGLVIGTNVQAWDADLDTIAGLTATTDNFMVATSSAWASRTPTQARSQLGLGTLATQSGTFSGTSSGTNTGDQTISNIAIMGPGFTVGGTGSAIQTGKITGFFTCPFAATITGWNIVVDTGTVTIKVWKIATGTAKPTSANSINTSGVALSTGTAVHSATTSDFTSTTVTANDIFAYNIETISGPTELSFNLQLTKT